MAPLYVTTQIVVALIGNSLRDIIFSMVYFDGYALILHGYHMHGLLMLILHV